VASFPSLGCHKLAQACRHHFFFGTLLAVAEEGSLVGLEEKKEMFLTNLRTKA